MDTQTAIQTLQGIANTLTDEVKGNQAKFDAVSLALDQLNGILATQNVELEATKEQLVLAQEKIVELVELQAQIPKV
jgi:hypothetical protein